MLTPIGNMVLATGEPAQIRTAPGADSADYNPAATTNLTPGSDVVVDVMGFPDDKQVLAAGLEQACKGAFTFEATVVPASLVAMGSRLSWSGVEQIIHSWRLRKYLGAIDGVTIYLAK